SARCGVGFAEEDEGECGGEEVDDDEYDGVDEEGENQVVPWSMTPPPVASSSSKKSGAKTGNMLLPHLPPSLHRGGTRRLRGAALPRPPHRAAAQGGEGVRGGRRRPIPCPARRAPCATKFESVVRGNATLAGTIFPGQIPALSGFSAQDIFLWFPVLAIGLDDNASGIIHLDVGVRHHPPRRRRRQ
ncbi:hypothetical protein BHE74_00052186, partial [Ensete ventricosum]